MITFSKELIQVVYGEAFLPASLFLMLYAAVYFLVGLGSLVQRSFFNGIGQTKKTLKMNLASFVVFLGLAPLLTRAYNVPGLIVTILVSNLAATMLGAYTAKKNFDVKPDYTTIFRIYIISFVSAIPSFLISFLQPFPAIVNIFLGSFLYLLSYLTLLPLANIISKPELKNLQQTTEKIPFLKPIMKPLLEYENKLILMKHGE